MASIKSIVSCMFNNIRTLFYEIECKVHPFLRCLVFKLANMVFAKIVLVVLCKRYNGLLNTVNSEIFARTLFSRNFAYAKFRENKTLAK